jgi:hypothetical protein
MTPRSTEYRLSQWDRGNGMDQQDAKARWQALGNSRRDAISGVLGPGEEMVEHGIARMKDRRGWKSGFLVVTDRRLVFSFDVRPDLVIDLPFPAIVNYQGFRKVTKGDLFVDAFDRRFRFNGGKYFIYMLCTELDRHGVSHGRS